MRKNSTVKSIKRSLVHVIPDLKVNSNTFHMFEVIETLKEYQHTVLFEGPFGNHDTRILDQLRITGADVKHVYSPWDCDTSGRIMNFVTPGMISNGDYDLAMLHNIVQHEGLGAAIPSLYYSYGNYDKNVAADITVVASEYSRLRGRHSHSHIRGIHPPVDAPVIHPGINTRNLKRIKKTGKEFTIGYVNTGYSGQYNISLVKKLMTFAPDDAVLYISAPDKYMDELKEIAKSVNRKIRLGLVKGTFNKEMLATINILIQGYGNSNYHSPYSRTVIEAMAMGIPVICERSGFLSEQLIHAQHCLFFDVCDYKQMVKLITLLHNEDNIRNQIGVNGKAWAYNEDKSVYMNKLRLLLRQLGN